MELYQFNSTNYVSMPSDNLIININIIHTVSKIVIAIFVKAVVFCNIFLLRYIQFLYILNFVFNNIVVEFQNFTKQESPERPP